MSHGFKSLLLVIAIVLVSGMILHAVIPHDHSEEIFGTGIQAALHGGDKKWWLLLLLSFFVAFSGLLKNRFADKHSISVRTSSLWLAFDCPKFFDPIREVLRRGRLQPILYE